MITVADKIELTKGDRMAVAWRHQFLQGSWNYERMQNGGWCYAMIPAIKALYKDKDEQAAALKRHLEFYNTQPFVSAPIIGVTLALEEERAKQASMAKWVDHIKAHFKGDEQYMMLSAYYAEQGYREEAKKIYSRLMLRYPEKIAYFASLIEKLDEKIKK